MHRHPSRRLSYEYDQPGVSLNRRNFLTGGIVFAGFAALDGPILSRLASAMGAGDYPQGMRRITGEVRINGKPAAFGDLVAFGDTVTTGKDSEAVFVVNTSAYLLRDNTEITIREEPGEKKPVEVIEMIGGKMMSVFKRHLFRKDRRRIITRTAVIGVRGTGLYVESEQDSTYFCLCYGEADIASKAGDARESYKTYYHEKPRYINAPGAKELISEAPVKNHSDAELILLESLVGRQPPFVRDDEDGNGNGNGGGGGY